MSQPKFRASYSVLSKWAAGQWVDAINMYFKLESFTSQQMADGKEWHDKWEKHVKETNTLPVEFGSKPLNNPIAEAKIVVELRDWLNLVGKIDTLDAPIIHEYKTGKQSSESYASDHQVGVYGVLCSYKGVIITNNKETPWAGVYVNEAHIHHYDQYNKKVDFSSVWITDLLLQKSYNWIETLASEMHVYFVKNDLYNKYGGNLKL